MNVKQGDFVNVDGVESIVETSWGQGNHKAFKLSDGRIVLDLDKLVASGKATVVGRIDPPPITVTPPKDSVLDIFSDKKRPWNL